MPETWEVVKKLPSIMRDPLAYLMETAVLHGDNISFNLPDEKARFINHPDLIQYVLQTNNRNYNKRTPQFDTFKIVAGNGLLNSDGDTWLQRRRIAQPAFHRQRLAGMTGIMADEAAKLCQLWQTDPRYENPVDIEQEMLQLTLPILTKALFNLDVSGQEAELVHTIEDALNYVMFRAQFPIPTISKWPLPVNRRYQQAMETINGMVYDLIKTRRHEGDDRGDVLSLFLATQDADSGKGMPDEAIRDELVTLIIAGYETAATGLTWLWYLLSQHPNIMSTLQAELDTALGKQGPTGDDLQKLPYLRGVVHEAWRLYPPSWVVSRAAIAADEIGGKPVEPGTLIIISPHVMHRNPEFWPEPERFDPKRFMEGRENGRHRFAYIPFGGGPRLCIGNHFAEMETMLIVATLAQHFTPTLISDYPVIPKPMVTIRPKGGMWMQVEKR
ncbi:MAG: cytochrome P450 [Chloroflexi bacterium]|nr:MAG: cytochrome P450 [Chloroflexota bacterium]